MRLLPDSNDSFTSQVPGGVTIDENALATEKDFAVITGTRLLNREFLDRALGALKNGGFLISREDIGSTLPVNDLHILTDYSVGQQRFLLLKKVTSKE